METSVKANSPIRADMSEILVLQPMIASTALFMKHIEVKQGSGGETAATNGKYVKVWPNFFNYRKEERLAILLHEYLHVAFAHPLRGKKLQMRLGTAYRHDVFNIAADGIINEGIKKGSNNRIVLPGDCIKLQELSQHAKNIVELTGVEVDWQRIANVGNITLEWLYDVLIKLIEAMAECQSNQVNSSSGQICGEEDEKTEEKKAKAKTFLEMFERPMDITLDDLEGLDLADIDDSIRSAAETLKNALAMEKTHGLQKSNIIEILKYDIPEVKTPWERAFRSISQRYLAKQRTRRPSRPGRSVLSQKAMKLPSIIWQTGRIRPRVPRVCVVLDTSGSVSAKEYTRYLSEIQAMKNRTNAYLIAVTCDTCVHSVTKIDKVADIMNVEFKGRGGTDFRPAIEIGKELDIDLMVYLTDLMGTFPDEKPDFPVLWTIPGMEIPSGYTPPFGRVLLLD